MRMPAEFSPSTVIVPVLVTEPELFAPTVMPERPVAEAIGSAAMPLPLVSAAE